MRSLRSNILLNTHGGSISAVGEKILLFHSKKTPFLKICYLLPDGN